MVEQDKKFLKMVFISGQMVWVQLDQLEFFKIKQTVNFLFSSFCWFQSIFWGPLDNSCECRPFVDLSMELALLVKDNKQNILKLVETAKRVKMTELIKPMNLQRISWYISDTDWLLKVIQN